MATRQDVVEGIKSIEDDGKNKASEVRDVLTKLLDYTENDSNETELKPFHFNNKGKPVNDGARATLLYSFKGIVGHSVNFTFKFQANSGNNGQLSFTLEDELVPILQELMQGQNIGFIVPLVGRQTQVAANIPNIRPIFLSLLLKDKELHMFVPNAKMQKTDAIFTSVEFHIPKGFNIA